MLMVVEGHAMMSRILMLTAFNSLAPGISNTINHSVCADMNQIWTINTVNA